MFFQIGFAVFLLLNTYALLRIRALLTGRRGKIVFTTVFLLVVFSFPLIEILAHSSAAGSLHFLLLAGYLSLPFMLYLFLSVLCLDLLRGINGLLKLIPREALDGGTARRTMLTALLILPVAIVGAGMVNNSTIQVNEYQVEIPRKSSRLEHLRIAVASDFHLRELTGTNFLPAFVERVNTLKADLMLIPGDVVEGDRSGESLEEVERQFRQIRTTYGVYATLGNHESYGRENRQEFFRKSGILLLQDTSVMIDSAMTLIGRNDSHDQRRKSIDGLMKSVHSALPVIVMDHKPTDIQRTSEAGADILISGHTHDGQLWPINYITDRIYDLSWGYRKVAGTNVFVTCGIQVWGPPVRTAGVSEIMVIDVRFN